MQNALTVLFIVFAVACSYDQEDTLQNNHTRLNNSGNRLGTAETSSAAIDTTYLKSLVGKSAGELIDSLVCKNISTGDGYPALLGICCISHYSVSINNGYHMAIYVDDYHYIDPCEQSFDHWDEELFMKEIVSRIVVQKRPYYYFRTGDTTDSN